MRNRAKGKVKRLLAAVKRDGRMTVEAARQLFDLPAHPTKRALNKAYALSWPKEFQITPSLRDWKNGFQLLSLIHI